MKLALPALSLALTTSVTAQFYNESAAFQLVLISDDPSVNGDTLSACHSGAAIEALCLSNSNTTSKPDPIPAATFHFNFSDSVVTPNETLGQPGILTYWLQTSTTPIPSAVELYSDPTTNTAIPLFYPGADRATTIAFDENDMLNIQGYINYSTSPPTAGNTTAYYRWWTCRIYYIGYTYEALVWVEGHGEPETPGCAKVGVKRVFI